MVNQELLFSGRNRSSVISKIEKDYFDVIVIGGGITGAGIVLDAASRGLKALLIEKDDFASGTSSKSTKLIHGGLRYLKNMEFSLVREVGRERAVVHNIAPHLVRPEKMLLPLIKNGNYGKIITSVGLMVYDVLADVESEDQRKMLSKEETMKLEPHLKESVVEGGGLYSEYQTDDFRLVIELIKASRDFQAVAINYMSVEEFAYQGGQVCGVHCVDSMTGKKVKAYADFVINAAGPWVDDVRKISGPVEGKRLHLTKGVHIVVPHDRLPVKHAVYFDVKDGRMIFAIPKNKVTYIGTTDTDYVGDPAKAVVSMEDVQYLLDATNVMFPSRQLELKDVESSWVGVRPLIHEEGKPASEISRKDEIFEGENGVISIAGGKLTGYRKMAKRVVGLVVDKIISKTGDGKKRKCKTKRILLPGAGFKNAKAVKKYKEQMKKEMPSVDPVYVEYLVNLYGTQIQDIKKGAADFMGDDDEINLLRAEVQHCLDNEMTMKLKDFYVNRTGRMFFDIESIRKTRDLVIADMTAYHNWDEETKQKEIGELDQVLQESTNFS